MRKFIVWTFVLLIIAILSHFFYLRTKAPKESYPDDTWLRTAKNKIALIIVAHDDDAISCAGTITQLCKEGWNIKELCFYNEVDDPKKLERIEQRKMDIQKVKEIEGLSSFEFVTIPFRNLKLLSTLEYMPVTKDEFDKQYNQDTMLFYIREMINDHKPSVIFTLDNQLGGYGHPDHKLVSQLVYDECLQRSKDSSFSVKYIYQGVFTPSMNENIVKGLPVYQAAIKTYGQTNPLPDVQVNIKSVGEEKKKILKSYSTEQNSLKKFWPYYTYYPAFVYFRLFDREFFRIIKL
jgi:LmbE family N-acetylglucosaminyl deacetylase